LSDLFVVICRDQPNSKPARAACLSKHLTPIENEIDRISFAATLKDDNDEYFGPIAIVKANSCSDARNFIRQNRFFPKRDRTLPYVIVLIRVILVSS